MRALSTQTKRKLVLVRRLLPVLLGLAVWVLALLPTQYFVVNGTSGNLLSILGLMRNAWLTVVHTDPATASTGWPAFSLLIRVTVILGVLLLVALSAFQFFLAFGSVFLLREKDRLAHRNHRARKRDAKDGIGTLTVLRRWFYTLVWGEWVFPLSGLGLLLPLSFPYAFRAIARRTLLQQVTIGYVFLNPLWILLLLWGILQILSFLWRTFEKDLRWSLFDSPAHGASRAPASDEEDGDDGETESIFIPDASGEEVNHERAAQDDKYNAYRFDWKSGEYEAEAVQIKKAPEGENGSGSAAAAGRPEGSEGRPDAQGPQGDGCNARGNAGDEKSRQGSGETPEGR